MKLSKRATWIASLLALPFVGVASLMWYSGATDKSVPDTYMAGDLIYSLGYPLTAFVLKLPYYTGRSLYDRDMWWVIPLVDVLFILQWIFWAQLMVYIIRLIRPKYR